MPILVYVVIALAIFAAGFGGGHTVGVNSQKVEDQVEFDRINKQLLDNKTVAAGILAKKNAENISLAEERDRIKSTLEKEREDNRTVTGNLERKYSGLSLRFRATKDAGCWAGSGISGKAKDDAIGIATTTEVQLPDEIAGNLRQLTKDADELNDDYTKCYNGNERLR